MIMRRDLVAALCITLIFGVLVPLISCHGRLIEPPSRASMWRTKEFKSSPADYNDHETYCGGIGHQWNTNGGKCGICGDPWDEAQPRAHEAGGKYGRGIIVRKYEKGANFTIRVDITASHKGYFEFRLCKHNSPKVVATQSCLDKHVLRRADNNVTDEDDKSATRYNIGEKNQVYEMIYMLPSDVTCSQCVLQWRYITGHNWGNCNNSTGGLGCGHQEEYRACADIAIHDRKEEDDNELKEGTKGKEKPRENSSHSNKDH